MPPKLHRGYTCRPSHPNSCVGPVPAASGLSPVLSPHPVIIMAAIALPPVDPEQPTLLAERASHGNPLKPFSCVPSFAQCPSLIPQLVARPVRDAHTCVPSDTVAAPSHLGSRQSEPPSQPRVDTHLGGVAPTDSQMGHLLMRKRPTPTLAHVSRKEQRYQAALRGLQRTGFAGHADRNSEVGLRDGPLQVTRGTAPLGTGFSLKGRVWSAQCSLCLPPAAREAGEGSS